jgi:hypothetical protein
LARSNSAKALVTRNMLPAVGVSGSGSYDPKKIDDWVKSAPPQLAATYQRVGDRIKQDMALGKATLCLGQEGLNGLAVQSLPPLPPNYHDVDLQGSNITQPPDVSACKNLKEISVANCKNLNHFPNVQSNKELTFANLSGCPKVKTGPNCAGLEKLTRVGLHGPSGVQGGTNFKGCKSLTQVDMTDCNSLQEIPNFQGCEKMGMVPMLDSPVNKVPTNFDQFPARLKVLLASDNTPELCNKGLPPGSVPNKVIVQTPQGQLAPILVRPSGMPPLAADAPITQRLSNLFR